MDDRIATALDDAVPGREAVAVDATGPSWNELNSTVAVTFADGGRCFLKVATDDDGSRIARERAAVAFVGATTDVPVPTVLAADPGATVPYLATAPVDGDPLLDRWDDADRPGRVALARRVGESLARLHERRFDEHGLVVDGDADGLVLETGSWTDVLVDRIEWYRGYTPSDRFDEHFDAVLAAVEANRGTLDAAPAALLHGDTAKPNCFVADDGAGFLDWELAHVGDPARDRNRARRYLGPSRGDDPSAVVDALEAGYRSVAGAPAPGAAERRPVYEAVWHLSWSGFFENHLEFVEESAEELATWVDAEMECRLAALE
jgi:aminoglycoside phosphotransferase (APT) family kinase protein